MVFRRIEAVQHRFHPGGEKSKIGMVCVHFLSLFLPCRDLSARLSVLVEAFTGEHEK